MRLDAISCQLVDLAPRPLQPGVLYVSQRYRVAVHLCACGCGEKVVTPLSPAEWQVRVQGGLASLHPSIGNWSMVCRSHYWIRNGRIVWSRAISKRQMEQVFARDRKDIEQQQLRNRSPASMGWARRIWRCLFGN